MNGTATHQITIVYDASHRSYVKDKLSKNILPPYLETPKDIAIKTGETTYWTELYHRANFHFDRHEISVTAQKKILFSLQLTPLGAPVPRYKFLESSRRTDFKL